MLTSLTGVYCGANPDILLEAAVTASEVMKHCGETAEARVRKEMEGTASFRTRLIDAVSLLNADELTPNLCLQILEAKKCCRQNFAVSLRKIINILSLGVPP